MSAFGPRVDRRLPRQHLPAVLQFSCVCALPTPTHDRHPGSTPANPDDLAIARPIPQGVRSPWRSARSGASNRTAPTARACDSRGCRRSSRTRSRRARCPHFCSDARARKTGPSPGRRPASPFNRSSHGIASIVVSASEHPPLLTPIRESSPTRAEWQPLSVRCRGRRACPAPNAHDNAARKSASRPRYRANQSRASRPSYSSSDRFSSARMRRA